MTIINFLHLQDEYYFLSARYADLSHGRRVLNITKNAQHVVRSERGSSVRKAGASRASSLHATQQEAIEAAAELARKHRTVLYFYGRDGRIRKRSSYGNDRYRLKG